MCGLTAPGFHFFKDEPHQPPSIVYNITREERSSKDLEKMIYIAFKESVLKILESKACHSFALSGGADSRLILSIILENTPEALKDLRIYTKVHPLLGLERDTDYLIAKKLSLEHNFHLEPEITEGLASAYFHQGNKQREKILSGLWGGELLGGQLFEFFPFTFSEINQVPNDSPIKRHFKLEIKENRELDLSSLFEAIYYSSCTAFYKSISWFTPSYINEVVRSPFLEPHFLGALFSAPKELLQGYGLYQKILSRYCSSLTSIDINNPFFKPFHDSVLLGSLDAKMQSQVLVEKVKSKNEYCIELEEALDQFENLNYKSYLEGILPYLDYDRLVYRTGQINKD